jgi:hypothetical protein
MLGNQPGGTNGIETDLRMTVDVALQRDDLIHHATGEFLNIDFPDGGHSTSSIVLLQIRFWTIHRFQESARVADIESFGYPRRSDHRCGWIWRTPWQKN